MAKNDRFRELLSDGIYRIKQLETKPINVIQDELGYAIGKKTGGSSIEHWRKGFIPGELSDLAALVKEIVRRTDLGTAWALDLLNAAQFPYAEQFCQDLLDISSSTADIDDEFMISYEFERSIAYRTLVGRQGMIETILRMLTEPAVYPIVGIDGIGGIGKTALVQEVMIQCQRKQLFEKIIWYSNRENRQSENQNALQSPHIFEALLTTIGTQLGIPNIATLNPQDKSAHIASFLRRNKTLVVLDNLETMAVPQEEMIRQLSPLLGKSRALLTSRQRFSGDLQVIHLLGLDEQMACQFLRQEGANRGIRLVEHATEYELQQIAKATGGLPLAMKLVVGQVDFLPLSDVLTLLQQVQLLQNDNEEDDYERFYQSIFAFSWQRLSRQGKALLIALALFAPGQGGTVAAISQVSALARIELIRLLTELWRFSFIERSELVKATLSETRYFLHPLVQAFVTAITTNEQSLNFIPYYHGCTERFIHYYATYTAQHHTKYLLMDDEHANLLRTLDVALERQLTKPFLQIVDLCYRYWEVRGFYSMAFERLNQALAYRQADHDPAGVAALLLNLGSLAEKQGQLKLSMEHVQAGLTLVEQLQEDRLKSELLHLMGRLWLAWSDFDQAQQALSTAMTLARLHGNSVNMASCLATLGYAYQAHGEYQLAESTYQEALQLAQTDQDWEMICRLWQYLGGLCGVQSQYERAEAYLTQGIELARSLGHQEQIAKCLHLLAGCTIMRGDLLHGEELSLEALAIAQNIGHLDLICTILINLGVVVGSRKDLVTAEQHLQQGLEIARLMNRVDRMTGLLTNLTRLNIELGNYQQAGAYLQEAETIATTLDHAWAKNDVLIERGRLKFKQGALDEATTLFQNALMVARELNVPEMDGDICWLLGQVSQALGHIEVAHTWGEACLQVYRAINHGDVGEVEEWLAKLDG
jgi:tetratricopeptide (TPR) repeat protein